MNAVEKYERCIELARLSPCQKLGFGALLIDPAYPETLIAEAYNEPILPLADMCIPDCCRFNIPSRTQSMLGACGHAEEACLWKMAKNPEIKTYDHLEIYVAGVNSVGAPLVKKDLTFTCIRCAVQMYQAGIRGVNVWINDSWHFIGVFDAVQQARDYAVGAMKVDSK
jgi:deoxycytidylate deaminase